MKLRARRTRKKRCGWFKQGRTDEWCTNIISRGSDDDDWKKNFRMSGELFHELLVPYISPNILSLKRRMIPADKKFAVTLHFLKDTGSLLMTASIFGIALSTASKIIYEVCKAMTEHLDSKCIRLPKTEEEMIHKAS